MCDMVKSKLRNHWDHRPRWQLPAAGKGLQSAWHQVKGNLIQNVSITLQDHDKIEDFHFTRLQRRKQQTDNRTSTPDEISHLGAQSP